MWLWMAHSVQLGQTPSSSAHTSTELRCAAPTAHTQHPQHTVPTAHTQHPRPRSPLLSKSHLSVFHIHLNANSLPLFFFFITTKNHPSLPQALPPCDHVPLHHRSVQHSILTWQCFTPEHTKPMQCQVSLSA